MLASMALISNSRALMKADTSSSPSLPTALSEDWAKTVLAEDVLTRFPLRCVSDEGCFLFTVVPEDILAKFRKKSSNLSGQVRTGSSGV